MGDIHQQGAGASMHRELLRNNSAQRNFDTFGIRKCCPCVSSTRKLRMAFKSEVLRQTHHESRHQGARPRSYSKDCSQIKGQSSASWKLDWKLPETQTAQHGILATQKLLYNIFMVRSSKLCFSRSL